MLKTIEQLQTLKEQIHEKKRAYYVPNRAVASPPNMNMAHQNRPLKKEMLHAELGVHVSFRGCVQVCFLC